MKKSFFYGLTGGFAVLSILFSIYSLYTCICMEQNIRNLQQSVNEIYAHSQSATDSEYIRAIDFLENEITHYREAVDKHQNTFLWIAGVAATGMTGLFAFFEVRGRKDISNIILEQYANLVHEEMARYIGGQDKKVFLENGIKKEEKARSKKILFLLQDDNENEKLMEMCKILKKEQYCVKKKKIGKIVSDRKIDQWVKEYNIIVYQVNKEEYKRSGYVPDAAVTYARIAEKCNAEKVYGILYCENNGALEWSLIAPYFYICNANSGLTAMERIFNMLYYV